MLRNLQIFDRTYIVEKISQRDVLLKPYSDHAISRHPPVIHHTSTRRCLRDQECTEWLSGTDNESSCSRLSVHRYHTRGSRFGDSGSGSDEEPSSISSSQNSLSSVFGEGGGATSSSTNEPLCISSRSRRVSNQG